MMVVVGMMVLAKVVDGDMMVVAGTRRHRRKWGLWLVGALR